MKRVLATICTIACLSPVAWGDDVAQLKQQVQALQQTLRSMQQAGLEKGIQSAEGAANVERVRREFQSLQGSFDALQFKLQNIQDSLTRYQQDADARLRAIEEKLETMHKQGAAPAKTSALDAGAAGGTTTITMGGMAAATATNAVTEATLYQKGLTLVRDGNYAQAANTFREFLQKYPKSSFAGNSQYWLAECFYAQKDYPRAIQEYQLTIRNYPQLDKIPKAQERLKLMNQHKPDDAIPLAPGAVKPRAELAPLPLNQDKADHSK